MTFKVLVLVFWLLNNFGIFNYLLNFVL